MTNTDWMSEAACRRYPKLGWVTDTILLGLGERSTMAVICERCPVRTACEQYVQDKQITGGFWAGQDRDVIDDQEPLPGLWSVA